MPTDARRLAVLLAVHRAGGVHAAADVLHVTPSAVSQQITRLEAEEGVQVLDRGPRGATLTPAGRILAESAERIEAELAEARKAIATLGGDVSGRVTVAAFRTAIRAVVGPSAVVIEERYPAVELVIEEREPADALRRLRVGDVDIALLERDGDADVTAPRGVRDTILVEEPWQLVLSTAMAKPAQLDDLRDAMWLGAEPDTAAARALGRVALTLGRNLRVRHQYYDFDVALSLVAAGQGVAMLPALALQGELPDGVTVVSVPGLGSRRLVARHRATRREPGPAVVAVLEALQSVAARIELD